MNFKVLDLAKNKNPKAKTITEKQLKEILLAVKTRHLKQLERINKALEKMPLFGTMRETNKKLSFGQYLTVLSEWWNTIKHTIVDVSREVNENV